MIGLLHYRPMLLMPAGSEIFGADWLALSTSILADNTCEVAAHAISAVQSRHDQQHSIRREDTENALPTPTPAQWSAIVAAASKILYASYWQRQMAPQQKQKHGMHCTLACLT